ncbi:hypothetical protein [Haladaptatus sp. NG-WS-4]
MPPMEAGGRLPVHDAVESGSGGRAAVQRRSWTTTLVTWTCKGCQDERRR